jgi:GNAT superfamily N-acetyltransferase
MKIATPEDFDQVFNFCKNFSSTLNKTVDEDKIKTVVNDFLSAPNEQKIVLLKDGEGMLAAFVTPMLINNDPIATEVAWWVEPKFRDKNVGKELVEAFEYWAKKLNCKYTSMACFADYDVSKFYESIGYKLHEKSYIKEI